MLTVYMVFTAGFIVTTTIYIYIVLTSYLLLTSKSNVVCVSHDRYNFTPNRKRRRIINDFCYSNSSNYCNYYLISYVILLCKSCFLSNNNFVTVVSVTHGRIE